MSHFGRSGPPDIADTYSLLVLNITFRTTADDLFPLFDKYGKVVDIFIPRDRRTGDSRGFAFVRYKYADEAQKAVERLDVGTEMTHTGIRTIGREAGAGVWTDVSVTDIVAKTENTTGEVGAAVSVLIMLEGGEEATMMISVEVPVDQSVDHHAGVHQFLVGVFLHRRSLQRMKS
ncbi:Serine/arginine-rich splicing factor SC35 [Linum perenne]